MGGCYTKELRMPMLCYTTAINGVFAFLIAGGLLFTRNGITSAFLLNLLFYVIITPVISLTMTKVMYMSENKVIVADALQRIDTVLGAQSVQESSIPQHPRDSSVTLKDVHFSYDGSEDVIRGVSMNIQPGQTVALVGPSGSGKSTLLHMMGGLDTPTSGTVIVRDKELSKMNDEQLTIFRRRNIGFIFQNYNLVPILNVYENIVLPVELDGDTVDQKFLDEIVHLLGLEDKLKNMPNNLSGGQQQRVAIARALITKPAIVLADEPTGNLDSKTSAEVLGLIKRTSAEFRQTVVMITHNDDIARLADRIVRIEDGKIVE